MKNGIGGVMGVVAAVVAVTVVSAVAQDDAPRRERRERAQGGVPGERRGSGMMERGGQAGGMQRGMGRETMLANFVSNPRMAEHLGLSSNQVADLRAKMDVIKKDKIQVRAELEIAGMEQAKLLSAEQIDEAALKAAVEKTGGIHTRLAMLEIQPIVELKKILTPAQIAMARDMMRERMRDRARPEGAAGRDHAGPGPEGPAADAEQGPMAPPPPPAPEGE
jgi:Spy/CpxP family protein refolding chaperone